MNGGPAANRCGYLPNAVQGKSTTGCDVFQGGLRCTYGFIASPCYVGYSGIGSKHTFQARGHDRHCIQEHLVKVMTRTTDEYTQRTRLRFSNGRTKSLCTHPPEAQQGVAEAVNIRQTQFLRVCVHGKRVERPRHLPQ
jgi:hypothetical protein